MKLFSYQGLFADRTVHVVLQIDFLKVQLCHSFLQLRHSKESTCGKSKENYFKLDFWLKVSFLIINKLLLIGLCLLPFIKG